MTTNKLVLHEVGREHVNELTEWLPKQSFPYHRLTRVNEAWVLERVTAGYFFGQTVRSFWAVAQQQRTVGLIRAFDLGDGTPLVDVRIADAARGQGFGTVALEMLTRFVFETFPEKHRLGGYTRADNLAMRRIFEKCGYLQEACHRQAWPTESGGFADAIGYAILRDEWSR